MAAETVDTSWMWHPNFHENVPDTAGRFVHFRKTLFVDKEIPTPLTISITADTRYKLYINKKLVAFGPVKGDATLWFYDEVDISPYLHTGHNLIAIHVLRLFHGTSYATSFPRLGCGGVRVRTTIDDPFWASELCSSVLWQTAVDRFVTLPIDQAEDDFLHIYEKVERDEKDASSLVWTSAILLQFQNSTGVTAPWKLSPRLIPHMKVCKSQFKAIYNVESALSSEVWERNLINLDDQESDLVLPPDTKHQLDLEAPTHSTAFIRLRFKRPDRPGAKMIITYSESYEDTPTLVPYLRRKGNRIDTARSLFGPQDIYNFQGQEGNLDLGYYESEHEDEVYVPFHWRSFRFLRISLWAGSSGLTLRGIDIETVHYPLDVLSNVSASPSDTDVKGLYHTSIRTLQNCMHDCYEDCPFYEQLQYAMDTRSSCLFTYYVSGDDRLARQAIIQLHNSFQPRVGLTASRAPSSQLQIIPAFSLYWICMLHDHFTFYNDIDFIRPFLPVVDAVLNFFHSRIQEQTGLVILRNEEGIWNFHDWADQWRPYGIPLSVERSGISTYVNSLYSYTLVLASGLQTACAGRPHLASEYVQRASWIAKALKVHCFDGRYFTDSLASGSDPKTDISQHSQIWAILCGAISGSAAQILLYDVQDGSRDGKDSLVKTSISMSFYTLRAMSTAGGTLYDDLYARFWQPWRDQMALNLTTWEEDSVSQRSDCHAWGSAPLHEFLSEVAGIKPEKPGWDQVRFEPRLSLYPSFKATVPFHRRGKLGLAEVSWSSSDDEVLVELRIEALARPVTVIVQLPGQSEKVMNSFEKMVFRCTRMRK
ncbi:Six-hairpin glycosidase-like protein [Fusarium flagelliforme]|uniref:Six-hairpin glycosidase-like protein n=1 Tax=Fusarium flagelliforme TaxID=2675880 RepID=UPI001E8D6506|nr:Six-hairpin glycosidase-like protein [Fusarium flagelliforme]KAH7198936.1 Six-hairpin glycosidase-like protein [Fusarium flagelliforme]